MSERKINPETFPKPAGVPDEYWKHQENRHLYIREIPHEKTVGIQHCTGNKAMGNAPGHVCRLVLTDWHPSERDGYFQWKATSSVLTDWKPRESFGDKFRVGLKKYPIVDTQSHGFCPSCEEAWH